MIDPQIPLSVFQPQPAQNPWAVLQQAQQFQQSRATAQQEQEYRQQQLKQQQALEDERRQKVVEAQQKQQQSTMLADAYRASWDPEKKQVDQSKLSENLVKMGLGAAVPDLMKGLDEANTSHLKLKEAETAYQQAQLGYARTLAGHAIAADFNPMIVNGLFEVAKSHEQDVAPFQQLWQQDPEGFKKFAQKLTSPEQPSAPFTLGEGQTRFDASGKQIANNPKPEPAPADYTLGNQRFSGQTNKPIATGAEEGSSLTPKSLDKVAEMFATTGQLPPLGMGQAAANDRRQIINRASELFPNVTLASNAAIYKANKDSLNKVTSTLDTLSAFESTANKNLDQFLSLASKIPDTGVPWLNIPVRMLDEKMVGSANMAAVNAARDVANREIARVTNDPKLSGQLTDAARAQVSSFNAKDFTFGQAKAVAQVLKTDMANVHSSLADQKKAIESRIPEGVQPSTPTPAAPTTAPAVSTAPTGYTMMRGPDGRVVAIANSDVEKAKARGAVVVR